MHDRAGRFVEHQQVVVLEQNVEREFLRLCGGRSGGRPVNLYPLARPRMMRCFGRIAVHANIALFNQPLKRAARNRWELRAQKRVEPFTRKRVFDDENGFVSGGHSKCNSEARVAGDTGGPVATACHCRGMARGGMKCSPMDYHGFRLWTLTRTTPTIARLRRQRSGCSKPARASPGRGGNWPCNRRGKIPRMSGARRRERGTRQRFGRRILSADT